MRLSASIVSNTRELTLEQLQETLKLEYDTDTRIQLMRKFCLQSSSADIQKKGMEFLFMQGFYDDLERLVTKNQLSDHTSNRNWAEIYQIFLHIKRKQSSPVELLRQIAQIRTSEPELLYLIEFAKINVQYNMNQYNEFGNFLNRTEHLLTDVDDRFLLDCFKIRLDNIFLVYSLMKNELIIARKSGYKILTLTENPSIKADVHIKLGLSYTFDSYSQGMYHLKQALEIAKNNNLTEKVYHIEQRNIPFLAARFKEVDGISTNDISEQAHIEIAKGNNEKAISLLNEIPLDTPFKLYYMGKAKEDRNLLIQAYRAFISERNDCFFSRLPLNELKKYFSH